MKFLFVLFVLFSFNAQAEVFNAQLDLTKLYGGYNAGVYNIKVETKTFNSVALSKLANGYNYEAEVCFSTLNFPVGMAVITVTNSQTGAVQFTTERLMSASHSKIVEGEICDTKPSSYIGTKQVKVEVQHLTVKIPMQVTGYATVEVALSPFALGIIANADIRNTQDTYMLDPHTITRVSNSSANVLTYYVKAFNPGEHLSLGNGQIPLN